MIRIAGRVADEIQRNGGGNWDAAYRAMVKAFIEHVQTGEALSDDDVAVVRGWASRRPSDEQADAMLDLSVRWVRANPTPVALAPPSYAR